MRKRKTVETMRGIKKQKKINLKKKKEIEEDEGDEELYIWNLNRKYTERENQ